MEQREYRIRIAHRQWHEWLGWIAWVLLAIFMLQNAVASQAENEPAAALIFWLAEGVILAAGATVYVVRRTRFAEDDSADTTSAEAQDRR